jgi:hypothetical protein
MAFETDTTLKIYFVQGMPLPPVGNSGAVVAAYDAPQAWAMAQAVGVLSPPEPDLIGLALGISEPTVIFYNTAD